MSDSKNESSLKKIVTESSLSSKVEKFNKKVNEEKSKQSENPFSSSYVSKSPRQLKPEEYGRPKAGSLTELRGKKANVHIYKEMLELCYIIYENGIPDEIDSELRVISFGQLFNIYVHISNKVVGLLLRARKYNLLHFEGEVLFQRFHDHVPIYLMHPMSEIKDVLTVKQDEVGLDK
ncbi:hypothetical protein PVAND_002194 [Polypedilum vanderplanki]|uniref:Costars domain-containing protein n=1 Tax=Polypedilum vanderplanki TaxID=319348 RepID=A0A9J6BQP5_POLVA|nr:hypothetical protein PVAND_002194 [Polypedilum vanderplanki]